MSTARKTIGIDASRANRPIRTGVEWYALHLIKALRSVIPADHDVELYTEGPLCKELADLPANWKSRVLGWPPRRLWTQARLSWEMLRRPPDLLFVPAHVIPLVTPKKVATTLHDVAFVVRPEAYNRLGGAYLTLMYKLAVRRALILTVSEFSKAEIVRHFGADPRRIAVTPLGYDAARFHPASGAEVQACLAKHGIDRPYFLFVGRLETKKNIGGLLKAFALANATLGGGHRLVLVGKPGHGYAREMAALDASQRDAVRQLGYVADDDLRAVYAGATALAFPSWYEGFGLPVIESFACGTPVVTSKAASIPEVAGDAALYVDPGNPSGIAEALVRIATDEALRRSLVERGAVRAREFTWERTAERTWEALAAHLRS